MGNNSSASFQYNGSLSDPYMTNGYCSFEDQQFNKSFRQVTNQGMSAIWSARGINSIAPIQRIGHATAYSCETDHSYIAYGVAEDSCFLTDVWDLDMKTCVWRTLYKLKLAYFHLFTSLKIIFISFMSFIVIAIIPFFVFFFNTFFFRNFEQDKYFLNRRMLLFLILAIALLIIVYTMRLNSKARHE